MARLVGSDMALQPIPNYGINVPDAGAAFEQGMLWRKQFEAQQLQQQEAENIKRDIGALGARPTVAAITDLITKYPQLSERFKAKLGQLSDEEKRNRLAIATPIYAAMQSGKPEVAKAFLRQQADALRNSGNEQGARDAEAQIKLVELDPNTATTSFGVTLAGIMGPDAFKNTFGELREQALAPAKLREAEAKATDAANNKGIQVHSVKVYPNGTTVVIGKGNEKQITNARGEILTGSDADAAVQAGLSAEIRLAGGKAGAEAGARAAVEAETAPGIAGKVKEREQAVVIANEAAAGLAKTTANIANLKEALRLSNNGANTGVIARYLPNVKAASVELANLRNTLGLDVVGGTTFGALSESELALALDTALPVGLDDPQLAVWLQRKIDAQEKVRAAFAAKARHFAGGGSLSDWLKTSESGAPSESPAGNMPPVNALSEGMITTFQNGQKWTLRNGQPVQVQ